MFLLECVLGKFFFSDFQTHNKEFFVLKFFFESKHFLTLSDLQNIIRQVLRFVFFAINFVYNGLYAYGMVQIGACFCIQTFN